MPTHFLNLKAKVWSLKPKVIHCGLRMKTKSANGRCGLLAGAGCIVLVCRSLGITIAFPQQLFEEAAKAEVDRAKG